VRRRPGLLDLFRRRELAEADVRARALGPAVDG
jgi:hypothetical protein